MLRPQTARRLFDAGVAAVVASVGVAEIWVPFPSALGEGAEGLSTAVVLLVCAALVVRRERPLAAAVVALLTWPVVFAVQPVLVLFWGGFVPMVVALFSVARHGRGREPVYGAAAAAATLLFMDLRVDVLQEPSEIVFHWLVFIVAFSVGWGLRAFEQRAHQSTQRAVEIEAASAERTMAAIMEERTRIARELHDVVAHSVSVMVVQAGAAAQVVDDDPASVRRALDAIRTTGTGALQEMRRVVALLREADVPGSLAPQPMVASLPELVADARSTGLKVSLEVAGEPRPLPTGVDLAAYRIVQEALTNVRRHASARTAAVLVRYGDDGMEVQVSDDGVGVADGARVTGGHGLIGMRERVTLYGGRLETLSAAGHGFTVRAWLPVAP